MTDMIMVAILPAINGYDILKRVYDTDGIQPQIIRGGTQPKILVRNDEIDKQAKQGWLEQHDGDGVVLNYVGKCRGRVQDNRSATVDCGQSQGVCDDNDNGDDKMEDKVTIRKLTERECLRLQGFNDDEIDKLEQAADDNGKRIFSRSAMYQFAGNQVCVNCFERITEAIIKDMDGQGSGLDRWINMESDV